MPVPRIPQLTATANYVRTVRADDQPRGAGFIWRGHLNRRRIRTSLTTTRHQSAAMTKLKGQKSGRSDPHGHSPLGGTDRGMAERRHSAFYVPF